MNCENSYSSNRGESYQLSSQNPCKCCNSNLHSQFDPVYPAKSNKACNRTSKKSILTKTNKKKVDKCSNNQASHDSEELRILFYPTKNLKTENKIGKNKGQESNVDCESNIKPSRTNNPKQCHPDDCCCVDCDINESAKPSKTGNNFTMVNSSTDKNLKNYMYDNPQLKESKPKKACGQDLADISSSDNEVWLLQCPKDFDPQQMLCCQLGNQTKVECSSDRFSEKKTLAIIAPEKAAEYELICDSLKLVKPVGKIVLSEKFGINDYKDDCKSSSPLKKSSTLDCSQQSSSVSIADNDESSNSSSDDSRNMSKPEPTKTSCGKKMSKKVNDQKFTIETTVTVENCGGGRKKSKKPFEDSCSPLKKKKSSKRDC